MKQPVLIPIGSRGHVSLIRLAASLNIDTQDRQDKQDEKLVHKKLIGSIIECAFVENLSVLRGPSRIPFESFPTPWNPFADSSFALLTDPLSPLVEILFPFPTFGGSLLSFLQPLSGPSSSFGRVEDWRVDYRVRWRFRRFRFGPQSGSPITFPVPALRTGRAVFPHLGSPVGSCVSHTGPRSHSWTTPTGLTLSPTPSTSAPGLPPGLLMP